MFSSEYTNRSVSVLSDYADLEKYNKSSQFGPPLKRNTPAMEFPILLKQKNGFGYDALSHGNEDGQYLKLSTAFEDTEPQYYVAKCPQNNQVQSFTPTPAVLRESYTDSNILDKLKDLRIVFFYDGSGRCPYSMKTVNSLKDILSLNDAFIVKDIQVPENQTLLERLNGYGTPFFYSTKNGTSHVGSVQNLSDLISKLETVEGYETPLKDRMKDLQIYVYISPHCIFCQKLKELFDREGVSSYVTYRNAQDYKGEVQGGVPYLKSMKTGKSLTGYYDSLQKIIQHLS